MLGPVEPRDLEKNMNEHDLWVMWARIWKQFSFEFFWPLLFLFRMTSVKELVILMVGAEYAGQKKSVLHWMVSLMVDVLVDMVSVAYVSVNF